MSELSEREPRKYRKKPTVIEAVRWTGDNITIIDSWIAEKGLGDKVHVPVKNTGPILIATIDGGYSQVDVGAWLLIGTKGEPYPCQDEIFRTLHEMD